MPKKSPDYELLDNVESIKLMHKGNAWMSALELNNGKTCLINPILGLQEFASNTASVSHILAVNHYHNKALTTFNQHYPNALLCSTDAARPRLEKITGLHTKTLADLSEKLPDRFNLIEPQGLKTGEVWLRFPVGKQIGWLVVDAFCGSKMTSSSQRCDTPELLKTFPSYGIANRDIYKEWVSEQIQQDKPALIIPCHGSIIRDTRLSEKLSQLISTI